MHRTRFKTFSKLVWNNSKWLGIVLIFSHWENSFFESKKYFFNMRSEKIFLWIEESYVNSKKISLIQRNRFVYIKENVFESTKFFSIQRKFCFECISKEKFLWRAVDRQSRDLGSNPSAVESVFFLQKDFKFFKLKEVFLIQKKFQIN